MFELIESVFQLIVAMFSVVFLIAVLRVYFLPFVHWHLVQKHKIKKLRNRTKFFYHSEEWSK